MKKVLIATLYNPDPVLLASHRLGADRLVLLVDRKPKPEQEEALRIIQESLGRVIDVKVVRMDVYDVVGCAAKAVEIIDMQPREDAVYVNITSGRKTMALGLLYAAYARHDRVKKIAYNPEEDKNAVVYLPRLSFKLTESQKKVLEALEGQEYKNLSELADKIKVSRAMLYRNIDELRDLGFVSSDDGFKLTDAGKIARL